MANATGYTPVILDQNHIMDGKHYPQDGLKSVGDAYSHAHEMPPLFPAKPSIMGYLSACAESVVLCLGAILPVSAHPITCAGELRHQQPMTCRVNEMMHLPGRDVP